MEKAVVTGANGFAGGWLVRELVRNGVYVYAVVRNKESDISCLEGLDNVSVIYCDLAEVLTLPQRITARDIDCFYHLAWEGSAGALRADYSVQLLNARYSCDAALAAKEIGCRKILCAGTVTENISDEILGLEHISQNMTYGICKKAAHLLLEVFCKKLGIRLVWMQFSNIYGPGDVSGNLISYALGELAKGKVPAFSKGTQPYNFIYVEDIANAAYLLGEKDVLPGTYFLGSGDNRLLWQYLSEIPEILGPGYRVGIGERAEDGISYKEEWFCISKLTGQTGFQARHSFREGIETTFSWMKEHMGSLLHA